MIDAVRRTLVLVVALGIVSVSMPAGAGERTGCGQAMVSCTLSDRSELRRVLNNLGVTIVERVDLDTLGMSVFSIHLPKSVSLDDVRAVIAPFDGVVESMSPDGDEYRLVIE